MSNPFDKPLRELLGSFQGMITKSLKLYRPNLTRSIGVIPGRNLPPISPSGPAGGVLSGSYPNPGFAEDMATQEELDAVAAAAAADLAAHVAAADPHPQYLLRADNLYRDMQDADLAVTEPDGTMYYLRTVPRDDEGYLTPLSGMPFGWVDESSAPFLRLIDQGQRFTLRLEATGG